MALTGQFWLYIEIVDQFSTFSIWGQAVNVQLPSFFYKIRNKIVVSNLIWNLFISFILLEMSLDCDNLT